MGKLPLVYVYDIGYYYITVKIMITQKENKKNNYTYFTQVLTFFLDTSQ